MEQTLHWCNGGSFVVYGGGAGGKGNGVADLVVLVVEMDNPSASGDQLFNDVTKFTRYGQEVASFDWRDLWW